uniref:FYVE-type domain-containing protein n=1 Tax=Gongylonema pulchrum TaxID=637853 RepID=A0A183D9W1_9BILA
LTKIDTLLEEKKKELDEACQMNLARKADIEQLTKNLERNVSELDSLRCELEAKKAEWQEEKRMLQERCLTVESDLECERDRAAINKKNFEDVQTGLQELGRVNQNLQMDYARQMSRKWLDDSEVTNCHACNKQFTLTVRKHHCRQCGQIFCATCSSFTAQVASSKSPVRVCSACNEEIMHR